VPVAFEDDGRILAVRDCSHYLNLEQMVEYRTFRTDLYYRLKVFPMTVLPLRERQEDIPLLVRHFAQKFSRRMEKHLETVPSGAMKAVQNYSWPGNVRELENFVERAVILTHGPDLYVPPPELKRVPSHLENSLTVTLEQVERDHILKALREAHWVIGGAAGAGAKLGMKRTTLQSKYKSSRSSALTNADLSASAAISADAFRHKASRSFPLMSLIRSNPHIFSALRNARPSARSMEQSLLQLKSIADHSHFLAGGKVLSKGLASVFRHPNGHIKSTVPEPEASPLDMETVIL
jgi:hypothetical protein